MPQVRISNGSLAARVDPFILPFLAPRFFTYSSIATREKQDGKTGQAQNEIPNVATHKHGPVVSNIKPPLQSRKWVTGSNYSESQRLIARTKLPAHTPKTRCNTLQTQNRWKRPYRIYSDIYCFIHRHVRTYTTVDLENKIVGAQKLTRRTQKNPIGVAKKTKSSISKVRGPRPKQSLHVARLGVVLEAERKHALEQEKERLNKYLTTRVPPGLGVEDLMMRGHYRSLRRRIYNLRNWSSRRLDLRTADIAKNSFVLTKAFAVMERPLYRRLGRYTRKGYILHNRHCLELTAKLFTPPDRPLAEIQRDWRHLDLKTRKTWFARLLLYLLDRKSGLALKFIQVLAVDLDLQGATAEAVADALGHLSKVHRVGKYPLHQSWKKNAEMNKKIFLPAFLDIYNSFLAKRFEILSQDTLYDITEMASLEDLRKVFDSLVNYWGKFKFDTLLHYAKRFGEASDFRYALRSLDAIRSRHSPEDWASVSQRERLRWACALILRKSMSKGENYHVIPDIVAHIVGLGVKMDIVLYNVIMQNAMEAGDHTTAFKVFNTLESNGLKADKRTYSILLYGCTLQPDPTVFGNFAQHCAEVVRENKDPWLATDILYYFYIRHRNDSEPRRSNLMWHTYLNFFSAEPLKPFVGPQRQEMIASFEYQSSLAGSATINPTLIAIYIMFQTEIKTALALNNTIRVQTLYQQFRHFAQTPALRSLARNQIIWNAFLHAFVQKQQFASASEVIRDMTDIRPLPNVYSWNIFMQAFFKSGQVQVAERAFDIMRQRGVEPDQYTYGVLTRGYAKAQLIDKIGEMMPHLDQENEMHPQLLRMLARVLDRTRLMQVLEQSRIEKEANVQAKAEREAEEETIRWSMIESASLQEAESSSSEISREEVYPNQTSLGTTRPLQDDAGIPEEQMSSSPLMDEMPDLHSDLSPAPQFTSEQLAQEGLQSAQVMPDPIHASEEHGIISEEQIQPLSPLNQALPPPPPSSTELDVPPEPTLQEELDSAEVQSSPLPAPQDSSPPILEEHAPISEQSPPHHHDPIAESPPSPPQASTQLPPAAPPPSEPPPSRPRPQKTDPELQYRALQRRLGILTPESPNQRVPVENEALQFDSVLEDKVTRRERFRAMRRERRRREGRERRSARRKAGAEG